MKKSEELKLTLNNAKFEEGKCNYQDKAQKLFQTIRV